MIVKCTNCGLQIRSSDMNLDNMVAKCRSCDSLIDLRTQLSESSSPDMLPARPKQTAVALAIPTGWSMNNSGGTTQISWRWFELQHIFLAFFCIAWDSFLIFWYSMALHGGPLIMIIFPIAHVAVGVGLTYYTLAGFLNRTTVQIGRRELVIRHGPMPWFSNRNINANDLREVNVNNTSTTNGPFNRQNVPAYRVDAVTSSGRTIPLLMLKSEDQARFVKQQIQERFAIKL